jgi:hypothetical protein
MGDAEAGILKAFDAVRKRIQEVAAKIYGRGSKNTYTYILVAKDFYRRKIDIVLNFRTEKDGRTLRHGEGTIVSI